MQRRVTARMLRWRRKPDDAATAPAATADPPTPPTPPPRPSLLASLLRFVRRATFAALLTYLAAACLCLSPTLQAEALFLHRVTHAWPPCDYDHPELNVTFAAYPRLSRLLELSEGLPNTQAHRVPLDGEGVSLGVWHTRPANECAAGDSRPWVLHLHGNGETRCWAKTARKTQILARPPFCSNVVNLDYRGFADSSHTAGALTGAGLLADAEAALRWLHTRAAPTRAPVMVYGHSLGSHVALAAAAASCSSSHAAAAAAAGRTPLPRVVAVMLEGAFTSPADVAATMLPEAVRWALGPLWARLFATPELELSSSKLGARLAALGCAELPIFQSHGSHDPTVALRLGVELARDHLPPQRRLKVQTHVNGLRELPPLTVVPRGGHDVLEEKEVQQALYEFWLAAELPLHRPQWSDVGNNRMRRAQERMMQEKLAKEEAARAKAKEKKKKKTKKKTVD